MPNIPNFRKTIGSYIGQILTPEIAVAIELSAHDDTDASIDPVQFGVLAKDNLMFQAERMADILPELHVLHALHWQETEKYRHGLTMKPDYASMVADERAGRLIQFTVRSMDGPTPWALVGNLRMYVHTSRHTGTLKAQEDTLYLHPDARGGMAALTLMRFAEASMLSIGVREIEADSKLVNKADVLMRRMKYDAVAIKFSKVFGDTNEIAAAHH